MKTLFTRIPCIFLVLLMMGSCHDDLDEIAQNETQTVAVQFTQKQQSQIQIMMMTRDVLGEIIHNKNVKNDIIFEASKKYDGDNNARFSTLLNQKDENTSRVSSSFANAFRETLKTSKNARTKNSISDLEQKILNEDLVIYAPYYEEFDWNKIESVTITYHPLIKDDINEGIVYEAGSNNTYTVLVNDDYAFEHPTLIIKPADGEEKIINTFDSSKMLPNGKTTAISVNQLSVGWVRCTKQYDGLFGGGPDFRFCVIGGKITSLSEAEGFENILNINLSRRDVRKKNWKRYYYELDDDWISPEDSRKFGLIDFDKNKTKHELKFSAKVKIGDNVEAAAEYKVTIESKEGWIKTDTYGSRTTFAAFNRRDMGHGTRDSYRVYKSGSVSWTLPLRKFTSQPS